MTLIDGCRDLSDVERETLEHAVRDGYFQSPRSATLGTLADESASRNPPSRRISDVVSGR